MKKETKNSGLTFPCHKWHVMSCHESSWETSFFGLCEFNIGECNVKWKSKSHPCNVKNHVGIRKAIEKSKIHEGSPRVIRELNDHPICYIYTVITHV